MIHAVILGGGEGRRFWPLSSWRHPKQFLSILSDQPMIVETLRRIKGMVKPERIHVATNHIYRKKAITCLKSEGLRERNFLFEPVAKNTFAPITLLTKEIYSKDKQAIVIVLPSDHYIKNTQRFRSILKKALGPAEQGCIVTLGISPRGAETGYGYLKTGRRTKSRYPLVERFIEKPQAQKAQALIRAKGVYWNAGIFIFRADIFLDQVKKLMPGSFRLINKITDQESLGQLWGRLPSISVDYAIMEKSKKLSLVPADCGWSDIGSWGALMGLHKKDKSGNVLKGKCLNLGSKNTFVWGQKRPIAVVGLKNIVVVDTKNGILVAAKDKCQDVKKIVERLKKR